MESWREVREVKVLQVRDIRRHLIRALLMLNR